MLATFGRLLMLTALGRLLMLTAFDLTEIARVCLVTTWATGTILHPSSILNVS
jgi:hypothetical protein